MNLFSKSTIKELLPDNKSSFNNIFDSLKYKDFKLYFFGQCISLIGTWMQQIAMSWLIYNLTGSIALLGTIVFMAQVPLIFITPFTSAFVDRLNKRNILIFTQALSMLHALVLTILVMLDLIDQGNIWIIIVMSLFLGIINALDMPTRQAFYTTLVPKDSLSNAVALNSAIINGARLIGPAIGGVLIGFFGEGGCFLFNTISYIFVIIALFMITSENKSYKKNNINISSDIKEGFNYMKNRVSIKTLLITTLFFSLFIFPLTTFFPAYVKDTLDGGSEKLGLVMAFVGIGSLGSAMFLAARKSVLGLGKLIVLSIFLVSLILIPFFFIHNITLSLILSVLIGFGMTCTISSLNTMLQALTEQRMKGRIMGYYSMCFIGGSALGSLALGSLTKYLPLPYVMAASGIVGLLVAIIFERYRSIVRKEARVIYVEKGIIPEIAEGIESSEI